MWHGSSIHRSDSIGKNQLWMLAGYGSDIASESRFFVMTCNDYLTFKSQPTWKPVLHKRENFQRKHEQLPKDSSSRNILFDSLTDAVCITSVAACMAMIRCQLETQQTKKRWKWIEPTIGIVSLGTYYRHLLTMDCPNLKAVPRYHCAYYMLWSHANTHGFGIPPSINCFPASNGAGFPTTLETWNSYAFRMPAIKWASSYACQLAAEACMVLTLKLGIEKSKMSVRFPGFVGGLVIFETPKTNRESS